MNLKENDKVRIYFNLHRKQFSVQQMTDKGWRVKCHVDHLFLKNVTFKVNESGRQKVIQQKKKNVHAFAIGTVANNSASKYAVTQVTYNPYIDSTFIKVKDGSQVTHAAHAYFGNKKVYIS